MLPAIYAGRIPLADCHTNQAAGVKPPPQADGEAHSRLQILLLGEAERLSGQTERETVFYGLPLLSVKSCLTWSELRTWPSDR